MIVTNRTVQARITKPIDHETKISLLRERTQRIFETLICSSLTKNFVSKINVHRSGTVSKTVFNNKSKPVDVPRSYREEKIETMNERKRTSTNRFSKKNYAIKYFSKQTKCNQNNSDDLKNMCIPTKRRDDDRRI